MSNSLTITVEKLVSKGNGLARVEGKVILVPFVLPGESVKVKITSHKNGYDLAEVKEILNPSPFRQVPACPHFTKCGGCDWLHIQYPEQLKQKVAIFQETMQRIGGIHLNNTQIESGPHLEYRNRTQIQVDSSGNKGFMRKGTIKIEPLTHCPVLLPSLNALFTSSKLNVDIKKSSKIVKIPAFAYDNRISYMLPNTNRSLPENLCVTLMDKEIHFNLKCFFQSNLSLLPEFIRFITEDLKGETVMDLYCGIGLFGAFLSDRFTKVIAVEENSFALKFAKQNIKGSNHLFLNRRLEEINLELLPEEIDFVVVNPPRNGLSRIAREFLTHIRPAHLTYVSCNPDTQARDLKYLLQHNFKISRHKLFDFYPQTSYVESVVKLHYET
ncbi:MAG: class I SAM-dependent RNA methyltransferase [Fibrobacteria bacterium]|nr:class I SAM-dependent RNA methyltransferase [Fibrobacteria bacterium]